MGDGQRYISLLSDYGFKVAFADQSNTLFLRRSLQALLQSDTPIKKVKFLRNEFVGLTEQARSGFFDLLCEDELQRNFIVEMQLGYYKQFMQRAKFYAFQRFNTLVEKGEYKFEGLVPIYCIGFLARGIFPMSNEYYHFGRLKNQKGEELDQQITYIVVEINKFNKKESEVKSDLDKLIYTMKNLEHIKGLDELPKFLTEDWIQQAKSKVDKSQMTPEQRMHFEMMLARNGSIIQMRQEERRQMREELVQEVREEVVQEMREEVAQEVREEVVQEVREEAVKETTERVAKETTERVARETTERVAKETAKTLKELGIQVEIIAKSTGLAIEEIEKL
ncbi:MAG: PD-(D/E)XK nuclease family transposase [Bacteroidota bacterium]